MLFAILPAAGQPAASQGTEPGQGHHSYVDAQCAFVPGSETLPRQPYTAATRAAGILPPQATLKSNFSSGSVCLGVWGVVQVVCVCVCVEVVVLCRCGCDLLIFLLVDHFKIVYVLT